MANMEVPKITDIFTTNTNPNAMLKRTVKHRIDEYDSLDTFEDECPMHKITKLDDDFLESVLPEPNIANASDDIQDFDPSQKLDFDLESFLQSQAIIPNPASHNVQDPVLTTLPPSIKQDKTLAELAIICDEPIKKTSPEEDKKVEDEIKQIANSLKDISKSSLFAHISKSSEKLEKILIENLKILYNTLVFKNYDFSKGEFNPESANVLYEHLYKVNVHIRKTEKREFTIYFSFPFYVFIRINMQGTIFIGRDNIYKKLEKTEEIDTIHYSSNNGYNILDVITAAKFICLITNKYFSSGFALISKLTHTLEKYRNNSQKIEFNKININFERFLRLYKQLIKSVAIIPCRA